MAEEPHLIQRSPEWHKHRAYKIGSSEASAIMGVSPWSTALDLYNQKVKHQDLIENNPNWKELILQDSKELNYAMRRGIELEPLALSKFEEETGFLMTPRVLTSCSSIYHFMSASLDGYEIEGKCAVEIKCSGKVDHTLALKGLVPEKYIPQLHHIMLVADLDWIYYMSYVSDEDFIIFKVYKDDDYANRLLDTELEFWHRHLQDRNPPQPTDRDIKKITEISFASRAEKWRDIQNKKSDILREEEELKSEIIQLADYGSAEGFGIKITKSIRRGHLDYPKIIEEHIGDHVDLEPYRKESTQMFRISIQDEEAI